MSSSVDKLMSNNPAPVPFHPFPGLRPFSKPEDSGFFFGRDEQVLEVIAKLGNEGIVVVVGGSGSGKSSLVLAGVVRELHNEAFPDLGNFWIPVSFTPGTNFNYREDSKTPITRLARKFAELFARDRDQPSETSSEFDSRAERYAESLCKVDGLTEIALDLRDQVVIAEGLDVEANVTPRFLVIVDQFEEIFHPSNQILARDDPVRTACEELIKRLLESKAAANRWIAAGRKYANAPLVFVALTMRSEHLNDCPIYSGLPNLINSSFYLLGKLNSAQVLEAVESPANLFLFACQRRFRLEARRQRSSGEDIQSRTSNLPSRIELAPGVSRRIIDAFEALQDDPEHFDQLPLLQHLLYRLWESALERTQASAGGTPVLVPDRIADEDLTAAAYPGGEEKGASLLRDCLDNWANRIWNGENNEAITDMWEKIFRKLAYKDLFGETYTQVRLRVTDIAKDLGLPCANDQECATGELAKLLAPWLHPHEYLFLDRDSATLKVSHESFIRGWKKLRRWTDEEHEPVMELVRVLRESADWRNAAPDAKEERLLREPRLQRLSELRLIERTDPSSTVEFLADQYFDRLPMVLGEASARTALPDFLRRSGDAIRAREIAASHARRKRRWERRAWYAAGFLILAIPVLYILFSFSKDLGDKESSRNTNYIALAELRKNMSGSGSEGFSSPSLEALAIPLRGLLMAYSEGRKAGGDPHDLSKSWPARLSFFESRVEQLNKLSPIALTQESEELARLLESGLWLVPTSNGKDGDSRKNANQGKEKDDAVLTHCPNSWDGEWSLSAMKRGKKVILLKVFDENKDFWSLNTVSAEGVDMTDCKILEKSQINDLLAVVQKGSTIALESNLAEMLVLRATERPLLQKYHLRWTESEASDPKVQEDRKTRLARPILLSSYGCDERCQANFKPNSPKDSPANNLLLLRSEQESSGWFTHYSLDANPKGAYPSRQWKMASSLPIDLPFDDAVKDFAVVQTDSKGFCQKLMADSPNDDCRAPVYFLADNVTGVYDSPTKQSIPRSICMKVMLPPPDAPADSKCVKANSVILELALVLNSGEGGMDTAFPLFRTLFKGDNSSTVYLGKEGHDGWIGIAGASKETMKIRPWSASALRRIACSVYSESDAKKITANATKAGRDSSAFGLTIIERLYGASSKAEGKAESATNNYCSDVREPMASASR